MNNLKLIRKIIFFFMLFGILLTGCFSKNIYQDNSQSTSKNIDHISHIKPVEYVEKTKQSSYIHNGITYYPLKTAKNFYELGEASWYGMNIHGKRTDNGDVYDLYKLTAAHKTLPLSSYVKVTNLENKRSIVLLVNDRGPFTDDRVIDLSYAAAKKLEFVEKGTASILIEGIDESLYKKNVKKKQELFIQIAGLNNYHNAQLLRKELYQFLPNYSISVIKLEKENNTLYKLRIGPVDSLDVLKEIIENLSEASSEVPYLVYEDKVD